MMDGLDRMIQWMEVFAILGLTLGLWKLVEILLWIYEHVHWEW